MSEATALERLLRRDRWITLTALTVLIALAWLYVVAGAGMGRGAWQMTTLSLFPHRAAAMSSAAMQGTAEMSPAFSPGAAALVVAMWWVMMIAMMTPSAAPTILLYARVHRHAAAQGQTAPAPTLLFAAGYLLAWLGFSLAAAALQLGLQRLGLFSASMMGSQSRWLSAGALIAAGLYQLTPIKNRCLAHCRAPASFLSRHWRPGPLGAARLGLMHGAFCVGCCWVLMALLFVGGVMNLAWIAAIALLVLAEKLVPGGPWIGRASGTLLIVWGAATLLV